MKLDTCQLEVSQVGRHNDRTCIHGAVDDVLIA
jgi:hypothetical protein